MSENLTAYIEFQIYDDRGNYHGVRHTAHFDAEQTRTILDTLPESDLETFIEDGTSNEQGDGIFHSAEAMAMVENHYGDSFTAYLNGEDEETIGEYLADRRKRGIPEDGVQIDMQAFHLRTKIQKINDLIESLPQERVIVWLAGDGSWGGLPGLGLYLPEQITEDIRDQYGIPEDAY